MKHLIAATVLIGISNVALAGDTNSRRHSFTEYATVIDVEPIFKRIRHEKPQQECWIEQEEHVVIREGSNRSFGHTQERSNSRNYSGGDALIGGLIGGVIGNQLGKKSSRGARNGATVAGAIVGSVIANEARSDDVGRHRRHKRRNERHRTTPQRVVTTRPVEHCKETMHTSYEQRVQGYNVTYEYRGRTLQTRMKRDPGDQIELHVNVTPSGH